MRREPQFGQNSIRHSFAGCFFYESVEWDISLALGHDRKDQCSIVFGEGGLRGCLLQIERLAYHLFSQLAPRMLNNTAESDGPQ